MLVVVAIQAQQLPVAAVRRVVVVVVVFVMDGQLAQPLAFELARAVGADVRQHAEGFLTVAFLPGGNVTVQLVPELGPLGVI